ncbi:Ig-like domain-containing protein [Pseudomonas sp. PB3P13]
MHKHFISMVVPLMLLAGCVTPPPPLPADWEHAHSDRDQITNDTFPTQLNRLPVVGEKKIIVVAVEWPGEKKLDPALLQRQIFSSDHSSLRSYIHAASGGKLNLTGRVISYVSKLSRPEYCNRTTYPFSLAVQEGDKGVIANGIDPRSYDYQFNILDCGGYASASVGGRNMAVYGQALGTYIYWHEFAHNLGSTHGNTFINCPQSGNTVTAPTGCRTIAYGDTGNPVGGGSFLPDAKARYFSGWLDDTQSKLIQSTGLYGLGVLGKNGSQGYRLNRPGLSPAELVLEYRKPGPYDAFQQSDNRANGLWIRYSNKSGALLTTQLDATPETASTADPTLLPGKTLTDAAAKISIHVCTATPEAISFTLALNGEVQPSCKQNLSPPDIKQPVAGAPASPNPIVLSGTSHPGAEIFVLYERTDGGAFYPDILQVADSNGNWRVTLPPALAGHYKARVIQFIAGNLTEASREFSVAP